MFITEKVNLPDQLIGAHSKKRLVIFAGAGVSMGEPSNLPDFEQLTEEVAGGTLIRGKDEPIDRFLGRLKSHGIDVHIRTREIINNPNSEPTSLHRALLLLFRSPDEVRIVTTNFDKHFSTVARDIFKNDVKINYAPALPLGQEFDGIVYLHGSVDDEPGKLILTDSDFGRAYLTEGWATRFLKEMFEAYTVLFVGYSHDDPVMHYLARGLIPGTRRYVMTKSGYDKDWEYLGITPINFPLKKGAERYGALDVAITAWVKLSEMGALDHEQRIRDIVRSTPPLNPHDSDYIKSALRNLVTVRFFTRYANTLEWLHWAESEQAFCNLFQVDEQIDEVSQALASWFANNFVCQFPNESLALIQRKKQILHPVLWNAIALELARREPHPDSETLAKWLPVLLNFALPNLQFEFLNWLLVNCQYPEDSITTILLFDFLTKPRLIMERHVSFFSKGDEKKEQVDAKIIVELDEHWFRKVWGKIFQPNLKYFFRKLEPILTNHLTQAHLFLCAMGKADSRWDPMSYMRSAIEPHGQNHSGDNLNLLIDAARDIIEWMVENEHDSAQRVILDWSVSDVPILKRLSIYGITKSKKIESDKKIIWILSKDWLYAFGLKHEIFSLLKEAYPNSSDSTRLLLIKQVTRGPHGKSAEKIEERTKKYKIYNTLVWLSRIKPDCQFVIKQLKKMKKLYPDFEPREHPDFSRWIKVGWAGEKNLLTVGEIIEKDPSKEIDWFLTYQGEARLGTNREDFLDKINEAVAKQFEWSWKLVIALQEKGEWNSDLWASIFRGWQQAMLNENQWKNILNFLTEYTTLYNFAHPISDLLERGVTKDQGGLPYSCLDIGEKLADQLYDFCVKSSNNDEKIEMDDWLTEAFNHPGGNIAKFWLHALSKRWAEEGEDWTGVPDKYKECFEKVLSGKSYIAQMGRIIFTSQLHFLFSIDADWTSKKIIPLFDWSKDEIQAKQAWHGYLGWGRWNEALLPRLLPLYKMTFPKLSKELSNEREKFCTHLAGIAIFSSINPIKNGWLRNFLLETDHESRECWARIIGQILLELNNEVVCDLWKRWISDYWKQRITGIPLPLSKFEKEEMIEWVIALEPVFSEAVERICASSAPSLKQTRLYYQLVEKKFVSKHATSLTKLLRHLLPNACEPFYHCNEVDKLLRSLISSDVLNFELLHVCDELGRLGCSTAAEIKELVEGRNSN